MSKKLVVANSSYHKQKGLTVVEYIIGAALLAFFLGIAFASLWVDLANTVGSIISMI
ncbi:Flp family type IVb pilin [Vibrio rotiferianus]|nr:Flp family type IVb pilin [Vibrio rotiferianus]